MFYAQVATSMHSLHGAQERLKELVATRAAVASPSRGQEVIELRFSQQRDDARTLLRHAHEHYGHKPQYYS